MTINDDKSNITTDDYKSKTGTGYDHKKNSCQGFQ